MFGSALQKQFSSPKTIMVEATIPRFWVNQNQFSIKFYILIITTYYFPLLFFINYPFCLYLIWWFKFNQKN